MKKFIRNIVRKVFASLFRSTIGRMFLEEMFAIDGLYPNFDWQKHNLFVEEIIERHDFVRMHDYDFDSFISSDDYDLEDFVTDSDYDFDSFVLKQDVNDFVSNDYITQTDLDDYMDFDPDDFVRCDDFDPDDYISKDEFDPDHYDFEDFVTTNELNQNQPTQHEVISFLTKLTLCATDYCTDVLQKESNKS